MGAGLEGDGGEGLGGLDEGVKADLSLSGQWPSAEPGQTEQGDY